MFDVTGMEVVVLIGAASFFLGKREIPQLARIVGRGTGKMVALLNTAREQFTKATQDTQFSKLHEEVQKNMFELDSIRSEVRSAGLAQARGMRPDRPLTTATPSAVGAAATAALSEKHGDIFFAPRGGPSGNGGSGGPNPKLGELAMAELLWQESAAGQAAGPSHAPPVSGADMMEDVILETLLREHMVRFAQKGAAEAASREMGDQAHGEDKKGR